MPGRVAAVSRGPTHSLSKSNQLAIQLLAGLGVEGDAHAGKTVKHRSRVARAPCRQLERIKPGLMAAVLDRDPQGNLIRKAGVMGIVVASGPVHAGDAIAVELPPEPHRPLEPV